MSPSLLPRPNIYGHFYGQPGPGIIFPLNTQGLGCLWPEHNTDLCQVLAARERERARRGSLSPYWEAPAKRSSPAPTKAAGSALPHLCPQHLLSEPPGLSSLGPDTQEAQQGLSPCSFCPATEHSLLASLRQAAGAAPRASALRVSDWGEQKPPETAGLPHARGSGAGRSTSQARSVFLLCLGAVGGGASSSQLLSHIPGSKAGKG